MSSDLKKPEPDSRASSLNSSDSFKTANEVPTPTTSLEQEKQPLIKLLLNEVHLMDILNDFYYDNYNNLSIIERVKRNSESENITSFMNIINNINEKSIHFISFFKSVFEYLKINKNTIFENINIYGMTRVKGMPDVNDKKYVTYTPKNKPEMILESIEIETEPLQLKFSPLYNISIEELNTQILNISDIYWENYNRKNNLEGVFIFHSKYEEQAIKNEENSYIRNFSNKFYTNFKNYSKNTPFIDIYILLLNVIKIWPIISKGGVRKSKKQRKTKNMNKKTKKAKYVREKKGGEYGDNKCENFYYKTYIDDLLKKLCHDDGNDHIEFFLYDLYNIFGNNIKYIKIIDITKKFNEQLTSFIIDVNTKYATFKKKLKKYITKMKELEKKLQSTYNNDINSHYLDIHPNHFKKPTSFKTILQPVKQSLSNMTRRISTSLKSTNSKEFGVVKFEYNELKKNPPTLFTQEELEVMKSKMNVFRLGTILLEFIHKLKYLLFPDHYNLLMTLIQNMIHPDFRVRYTIEHASEEFDSLLELMLPKQRR